MKKIFKLYNIFLLLLIVFFIGLVYIYEKKEAAFKIDTITQIKMQSKYIDEYFMINKAFILSLKNTLSSNLNIQDLIHPAFNEIKNKPKLGIYNILCNLDNIKSTLNGLGRVGEINLDTVQELNSVLYLNPLFKTILNSKHDIQWVYYTSAKNFIYIAPSNDIWDDKFLEYTYTKEFWTEAILENNPSGELVLTKIYQDAAGKGYMSTLSLPIFFNQVFKGVLSIDISLKTLNKMIHNINLPGKLFLINDDDLILASNQTFELDQEFKETNETFSLNLFENKLKLIYIENQKSKIYAVISSSIAMVMLLIFILVIIYILAYQIILTRRIKEAASKDFLTSLLNRRAMIKQTTKLLNIANRYEQEMSLLLIDIDLFKKVNDTFGHQIGDLAIQKIAEVFSRNVRESDLVSRYGGEEFLILLYNTDLNSAYLLAERIRKEIFNLRIEGINFPLTISIGCTKYKKDETIDTFINRADLLLYKAKEKGRNQTIKD